MYREIGENPVAEGPFPENNIILKVMNYTFAKFNAILSANMDTDNIFQFIVNFAQNLTILPQNSKVLTYTALKHI